MDFDAYEYLERTVENPQPPKSKETSNGAGDETMNAEGKESARSSRKGSDNGDVDDGDGRMSKRSKSRDEYGSRDRHRSRSRDRGSHHRSKSRDKERHHRSKSRDGEREKHRSSRDHREKDRDRDKYGEERNGRSKLRDKDRDRSGDPDRRERERDREKGQSHRSRSQSERRSDRDVDRERSGEKEHREREKEFKDRDRDTRRHKEKKENVEPEVDPERDQRTVFAYQISLKASERDVYEFFSRAGKVRDVRLIMDRITRRSKGVGYVEFYDAMSVPMAIALSGQLLLGQPVMVKPSEAEKNLVQSTAAAAGASGGLIGPYSGGARRLYVGNLHVNMTEEDLRKVFEPFGTVELVQLPRDETGHCKGFGFVQFTRLEDARNALNLNGQLEIAGRAIKVSAVTDQSGTQEAGQNTGDLDDDDGGLSLNAQSRALLMQKLDRTGTATSLTGSLSNSTVTAAPVLSSAQAVSPLVAPLIPGMVNAVAGLPGAGLQLPGATISPIDTIGTPSECLLLKNMFDPKAEMEPDFDLDIKEDVQDECSKFGNLKHIYVDKNSAGFVYLRFENAQSAMSAQRALHGRWFAGNMITATFMTPQTYEAKFPDGKN